MASKKRSSTVKRRVKLKLHLRYKTKIILDCIISILACVRMYERRNNIKPRNKLEEILDEKYPDEYLNDIYNNAKKIKKH